jgi:hypothetical protein
VSPSYSFISLLFRTDFATCSGPNQFQNLPGEGERDLRLRVRTRAPLATGEGERDDPVA